jgi:alkylresorcinol/alkylpyrone synthase
MGPLAPAPSIRAVGCALPPHYADQETIIAALRELWAQKHINIGRLEELHRSVQVGGRHLSVPIEEYPGLDTFEKRNDAWIRVAEDVGAEALTRALDAADLGPRDIDHIFFVTVTGVATPSIDARLINRLGMRPDVKRTPIFGLGCVAGAAGTARAADYLRAFPGQIAALLSVELCSLTHQREDLSIANIIASGLFGDGAAALVLAGGDVPAMASAPARPSVVASTSVFYPDTEDVMGWQFVNSGFKVILSAKVPTLVRERIGADVDAFLEAQGLRRSDVRHWVAHTGGPKVLEAMQEALDLPPAALERSWRSLSKTGNLSSASVLFVLGDLLDAREASPGDVGLLMAMGPGFCSELVLLRW